MTYMDKLIKAVDNGTATAPQIHDALGRNALHAISAYNGDMNAAKALHEALLPVFRFRIDDFRAEIWYGHAGPFIGESQVNPARAWLLAILKAYREETQK